jgi:ribosomal protein L16 Arg81 hydroxylase
MKTSQLLNTIKSQETFFKEDVFSKKHFHFESGVSNISEILSLAELDEILNENVLDPRVFLLFKNGQQLMSNQIFGPNDIQSLDKDKVNELVNEQKYSLKIFNVEKYSARLTALKAELSQYFLRKISFNLYLTPAKTPCFLEHQDNYDVFIAQLEGSKQWHVHEGSTLIPVNSAETKDLIADAEKILLKKGDLFYVPPSMLHKVENLEDYPSLHLTIGLHPLTYEEVFMSMLKDRKSSLFFKQPVRYEDTDVQIGDIKEKMKNFMTSMIDSPYFETLLKNSLSEKTQSNHPLYSCFNFDQALKKEKISEQDIFEFDEKNIVAVTELKPEKIRINCMIGEFSLPMSSVEFRNKMLVNKFTMKDFKQSEESDFLNSLYRKGIIRIVNE